MIRAIGILEVILASFLLNGCLMNAKITSDVADYAGKTINIVSDPQDKFEVRYISYDKCLADCGNTNVHIPMMQEVYTTSSGSELEVVSNVWHSNVDKNIRYKRKIYHVKVKQWNDKKGSHVSLTPYKVETIDKLAVLDSDASHAEMHDASINIEEYLANPDDVVFQVQDEYVSKYDQASVFGNLKRKKLFDTNKVAPVSNRAFLNYDVGGAQAHFQIETIAYHNGTMVSVYENKFSLSPAKNSSSLTRDLREQKKKALRILKNAVED